MANLNKVMLIGRIGSDPEIRTTQKGSSVTTVSVAVNYGIVDRHSLFLLILRNNLFLFAPRTLTR